MTLIKTALGLTVWLYITLWFNTSFGCGSVLFRRSWRFSVVFWSYFIVLALFRRSWRFSVILGAFPSFLALFRCSWRFSVVLWRFLIVFGAFTLFVGAFLSFLGTFCRSLALSVVDGAFLSLFGAFLLFLALFQASCCPCSLRSQILAWVGSFEPGNSTDHSRIVKNTSRCCRSQSC